MPLALIVCAAAGMVQGGRSRASMGAAARDGVQHYDAVVVGAGPTGMAAALELRKRGARVALLERSAEPGGYDAERAFLYLVDGRGQAELGSLGLLPALFDAAVSQEVFKIAIVTDSATPVSEPMTLPTIDVEQRKRAPAQWIPRNRLVELMERAVAATEHDTAAGDTQPPIARLYGCELASLALDSAADRWRVRGGGAAPFELTCALVVGADGINSAVRAQLATLAGGGRAFSLVRRPSASAGLRYKVLTLPPNFKLARGSDARAVPEIAYSVRGTPSAARPLKAGLLPLRSDARGRTANFITRDDHPLWTHGDARAMARYLADTFPHVQLDEAVLGRDELERFARSKGGHFPAPQHCLDAALAPRGQAAGAVLAGDALHAFPPDLGQGVNSGLQDVAALAAQLDSFGVRFGAQADPAAPRQLGAAVAQYGRERAAEAAALTRLVQLGAPFQYGQEKPLGKLRQAWWGVNVLLRLQLAKLCPSLFQPQIFTLVQNPTLSYTEVLRRANRTTAVLQLLLLSVAALALAVAKRGLLPGAFPFAWA